MTDPPRFSRWERFIYASGYLGVSLLTFSVSQWLQSYYVPTTGAKSLLSSAALLGTALIIARIVDGFADPFAGYFSDTARTPIGRRRPFLLIFGPLAGLAFAMLFPHVTPGREIPFVQFVITLCAYYFFFTMAVTPYLALLPEIARSDTERLGVTSQQTFFNFLGIGLAMVLGAQISPHSNMAMILGGIGGLALMVPGLFLTEPPLAAREGPSPNLAGMFLELWEALQNRIFLLFVVSQLCLWFGFNMILAWIPYLVERLLHGPSVTTANLAVLGTAVVSLPIAYKLVVKLGKVRGLMVAMSCFAIGFLVLSQLVRLPAPPIDVERLHKKHHVQAPIAEFREQFAPEELAGDPATPNQRWQVGFIVLLGLGLPLAIFFLTPNAILAQVIDLDKQRRGGGREGMFFAAQAVVIQSGGAASGWVLNRLLTQGGDQATLGGIVAVGPVAAAVVVAGVLLLWRFEGVLREASSEVVPGIKQC